MPNWCYQKLKVKGSAQQIEKFQKDMLAQYTKELDGRPDKGKNEPFTFGLFKEFPLILNACDMLCGTNGHNKQQPTGKDRELIIKECGKDILKETYGKNKPIDPVKLSKYLLDKYGNTGWHDWNCSNWGTKWNACDVSIIHKTPTELTYRYDTAWSPALAALEFATAKYPELTFRVTFTEESTAFAGVREYHGGQCTYERDLDPNMSLNGTLEVKYIPVIKALVYMPPENLAQVQGTMNNLTYEGEYYEEDVLDKILLATLAGDLSPNAIVSGVCKVLNLSFKNPEVMEVFSTEDIITSRKQFKDLLERSGPEEVKHVQSLLIANAKKSTKKEAP